MSKVAVVVIHGIGSQDADFYKPFENIVRKNLNKPQEDVKFFSGFWQDLVEEDELANFRKIKPLGYGWVRKLMLSYTSDAILYQQSDGVTRYAEIHERLDGIFQAANDFVGENGEIIVVAHSLGSVIINNFIWDVQNPDSRGNLLHKTSPKGADAVGKINTLYTLGSPMFLWSLRFKDGGASINVPTWFNFFSSNDVIGFPIRIINEDYCRRDYIDVKASVGPIWARWNPASHVYYLDNAPIAKFIGGRINYL